MPVLSEAALLSSKDLSSFGAIEKNSFTCFHKTPDLKSALNIQKQGFNLKKFGNTAKAQGAPDFLWKNDPVAVFACRQHVVPNDDGGFVEILVSDANVLSYKGMTSGELKRELYSHLDCISAKDFTDKLREFGIDAIASSDPVDGLQEEVIIVNPQKIQVIKAGFEVNPQPQQPETKPSQKRLPRP